MMSLRKTRKGDAGAELIEFAVVFPLLLMVLLGIVEFAFVFQRNEVITNAAREGARIATLPGYIAADVSNRVTSYLQVGGLPTSGGNPVVVVTPILVPEAGGTWPATQVDVTYNHQYMFIGAIGSWFGGAFNSVTLGAQATMRNELGNAPVGP